MACGDDAMSFQVKLSEDIKVFIQSSTGNYGKAKLVLQRNKFFIESPYPEVLKILLKVPPAPFTFLNKCRSLSGTRPGINCSPVQKECRSALTDPPLPNTHTWS